MTNTELENAVLESTRELPSFGTLMALATAFLPHLGASLPKLVETPPIGLEGDSAEARARKAELRYQALVEQIPVVTFLVSFGLLKSEIYVSPYVEKLLGYTAKEWVEDPILWYQRLHTEDRLRWNMEFSRTIALAEPFRGDYRFVAKNGRIVWIHGEVTVVRDASGRPSFLQGIGYEITELKLAEEVLRRSGEELDQIVKARTAEITAANISLEKEVIERKRAQERQTELVGELKEINEQLNQFAYVVSHDLKAPLRAISSLADWLMADYGDKVGEAGREQFTMLLGRTNRMNTLVDGILRYSRITRQHEVRASVDVNQLLAEICELLSPPEGMKVHIASGLPTVVCERTRLLQVFENLISNAMKYMGRATGDIFVGCEDARTHWKFHVRDTGPGIEEKYYEKIFQIFQTLVARDERESTGIGLAIVKKNVELSGGRVWVESKVGEGSTFYFTLPKLDVGDTSPPTEPSKT
jgi:PAS domain S-box-containing protein